MKPKVHSMKRRCFCHDYYERGIYMITLEVEGRRPILGELVGERVELSELGRAVPDCWRQIPRFHPEVSLIESAVMRYSRGGGCQIDLLIQTARTAYVVETKRQNEIGREVEEQVAREMKRLHIRNDMSVRPVLVYLGNLDGSIDGDGFFDAIVPAQDLLKIGT